MLEWVKKSRLAFIPSVLLICLSNAVFSSPDPAADKDIFGISRRMPYTLSGPSAPKRDEALRGADFDEAPPSDTVLILPGGEKKSLGHLQVYGPSGLEDVISCQEWPSSDGKWKLVCAAFSGPYMNNHAAEILDSNEQDYFQKLFNGYDNGDQGIFLGYGIGKVKWTSDSKYCVVEIPPGHGSCCDEVLAIDPQNEERLGVVRLREEKEFSLLGNNTISFPLFKNTRVYGPDPDPGKSVCLTIKDLRSEKRNLSREKKELPLSYEILEKYLCK